MRIDAVLAKAADRITLHSVDLAIRQAAVNGQEIAPSRIAVVPFKEDDPNSGTLTMALDKPLPARSPISIDIRYAARLNRQMRGLYLSTTKVDGHEEKYAFSQFEPADFRRMAPSVDEPEAKATFSLTVSAPADLTVRSNMSAAPGPERRTVDGFKTVRFPPTPRMSSYLVMLAVARLAPSRSVMADGTRITAWATPDKIGQTSFALAAAKFGLKRFNDYYGVKFPLPKLDLVLVPDFSAGAMENWGAITFRDSAMLIDPRRSSTTGRRRVSMVTHHEESHQWTGDLVTMKNWGGLWLNEAFAEFMGYKATDWWHPEWNSWHEFNADKRRALKIDSLKSTRPVQSRVKSPADAEAQFDLLTYQKGSGVLRMFEQFLGEEKFRDGLRLYMRTHKYGNTSPNDLWSALEKVSGVPVRQMAKDWFNRPGYPMVAVQSASRDNRTIRISQEKFRADGSLDRSAKWTIPILLKYQVAGESRPRTQRVMLKDGEATVRLQAPGKVEWVYPNAGDIGYYRTDLRGGLAQALKGAGLKRLDPSERTAFLDDSWSKAVAGRSGIAPVLDAVRGLRGEASRPVLAQMADQLTALSGGMARTPAEKARLSLFAQQALGSQWKKLGWTPRPGEDDEDKLSRAIVLSALGQIAQPPELVKQARENIDRYIKNPKSVDAALVSSLLGVGAHSGDMSLFETYREQFRKASNPEIAVNGYLKGMAGFQQPEAHQKLMAMALTGEIRGQDVSSAIGGLLANPSARDEAWKFVQENWAALRGKAGDTGAERIIEALSSMRGEKSLREVRNFFARPENQVASAGKTLKQTLEGIRIQTAFENRQQQAFSRWLSSHIAVPAPVKAPRNP